MIRVTFAAVAAALILLAACGQKDNTTPQSQPGSPAPKPLTGEPQPSGGTSSAVIPGEHPATPGGAPAPGEGRTPADQQK